MQASRTHFERIPVETVKQIAKELPAEDGAMGSVPANIETQPEPTCAQEHWRELAQRIQQEKDPNKLIGLVEKLIVTFDGERKPL